MKRRFGRKKRKKPILLLTLLMITMVYLYYITEKNVRPTITALAEIKARLIATQAINEAVKKKISGSIFENLILVKTDNLGKVTMVQANTIEMNKIASETSIAVQEEIRDIDTKEIKIPISNIFGSHVLANTGPKINIKIQPAGSVSVDFNTDFEEAGINQTRLKIYLIVNTKVRIMAPLARNEIDVTTHIPVSETIIVGDVPESYIHVPKDNNDYLNFIPTKDPLNK